MQNQTHLRYLALSLLIAIFFMIIPHTTHALTRLRMEGPSEPVSLSTQAQLKIRVMSDESDQAGPKEGEKVSIKIKQGTDLEPSCSMTKEISGTDGLTTAQCTMTKKGTIIVYAQSVDKSDTSNEVELRFDDIPTPTPTPQQTEQQPNDGLNTSQSQRPMNPANTNSSNPYLPGLQDSTQADSQGGNGLQSVLGESSTKTEDLNLATSLIFFVAGIVLLITASYALILLTKKKKLPNLSSDHEKKEEQPEAPKA